MVVKSTPISANNLEIKALAAPLAPSTTTLIPLNSSGKVFSINCKYLEAPSW